MRPERPASYGAGWPTDMWNGRILAWVQCLVHDDAPGTGRVAHDWAIQRPGCVVYRRSWLSGGADHRSGHLRANGLGGHFRAGSARGHSGSHHWLGRRSGCARVGSGITHQELATLGLGSVRPNVSGERAEGDPAWLSSVSRQLLRSRIPIELVHEILYRTI